MIERFAIEVSCAKCGHVSARKPFYTPVETKEGFAASTQIKPTFCNCYAALIVTLTRTDQPFVMKGKDV